MNDQDLDICYTALCRALGEAGEAKAPLLLSMLSLSLIARQPAAGDVLPLIDQALRRSADPTASLPKEART